MDFHRELGSTCWVLYSVLILVCQVIFWASRRWMIILISFVKRLVDIDGKSDLGFRYYYRGVNLSVLLSISRGWNTNTYIFWQCLLCARFLILQSCLLTISPRWCCYTCKSITSKMSLQHMHITLFDFAGRKMYQMRLDFNPCFLVFANILVWFTATAEHCRFPWTRCSQGGVLKMVINQPRYNSSLFDTSRKPLVNSAGLICNIL